MIAVPERILQRFQDDDSRAVADERSGGSGVKRAAMTIRRVNEVVGIVVAFFRREGNVHTARNRDTALAVQQCLAGQMHGNQRR